jgi:hypothetical protein
MRATRILSPFGSAHHDNPCWRRILSPTGARLGLTLIEIMVSLTLVLVIMVTTLTIFGMIAGAVADSRAMMDLVDREKAAVLRLQADLDGVTVQTIPWVRPESASGYLLYVEGGATDAHPVSGRTAQAMTQEIKELGPGGTGGDRGSYVLGDTDDVLMMTVHSRGTPFVGRGPQGMIESNLAEVVWFVAPAETDSNRRPLTLYRRVLLIRPDLDVGAGGGRTEFFNKYDISARFDEDRGTMVPNTLADLTQPENRFSHSRGSGGVGGGGATPAKINLNASGSAGTPSLIRPFKAEEAAGGGTSRLGDDVILTNCVGFDIKIFDARARVNERGDQDALVPGDFKYAAQGSSLGAYVDLGPGPQGGGGGEGSAGWRAMGPFSHKPHPKSRTEGIPNVSAVYDTWSFHYEHDGQSQRGGTGGSSDTGTDGMDLGGNGVDDATERETSPPYTKPLRGLQIKVRCYEPASRQVREVTVVKEFSPR